MDAITRHHLLNIANDTFVENDDGSISTVNTIITGIDGVDTLIPTVWDGQIVDDETAVTNALSSGMNWPQGSVEQLQEFDRDIHQMMSDRTTQEEASQILKSADEGSFDVDGGSLALSKETFDSGHPVWMFSKDEEREEPQSLMAPVSSKRPVQRPVLTDAEQLQAFYETKDELVRENAANLEPSFYEGGLVADETLDALTPRIYEGVHEVEPPLEGEETQQGSFFRDFFSRQAGQDRTETLNAFLNNTADYYLGPTGVPDKLRSFNEVFNPVVQISDAGQAVQKGDYVDALTQTAGAALPVVGGVAPRLVSKAATSLTDDAFRSATAAKEALTGFQLNPNVVSSNGLGVIQRKPDASRTVPGGNPDFGPTGRISTRKPLKAPLKEGVPTKDFYSGDLTIDKKVMDEAGTTKTNMQYLAGNREQSNTVVTSKGKERPLFTSNKPNPYEEIGDVPYFPGFKALEEMSTEDRVKFVSAMQKENLEWVMNRLPQGFQDRTKLWYTGANRFSEELASKYGVPRQSMSGVIAALSPQKNWFENASLAERVADAVLNNRNFPWSSEMSAVVNKYPTFKTGGRGKNAAVWNSIQGKKYSELETTSQKAMWVRAYDEAHNPKTHRALTPEGDLGEIILSGNAPKDIAWGGFNSIEKAVDALESGGDFRILSDVMGGQHKVRNFFNNIEVPFSDMGDVTIDTHAIAAALMRPLGGDDRLVAQGLGALGGQSGSFGAKGSYGLIADDYREVAANRGLLPRELQSITWEGIRSLFNNKSDAVKRKVNTIWSRVDDGTLTQQQALDLIEAEMGGFGTPNQVLSPRTKRSISSGDTTMFALGGLSLGDATKGITTEEGKKMANKKFQLDPSKADPDGDGKMTEREKMQAEAKQKAAVKSGEVELDDADKAIGMNCGGLMMPYEDDIDPVSGNPIPIGSNPENVRDDISANLSQDEYVLPANVVKWHGLKHIQEMHMEAEAGLMSMDMIGLIGGQTSEVEEAYEEVEDADEGVHDEDTHVETPVVEVEDELDDSKYTKTFEKSELPGVVKKHKFAFIT